MLAELPRQNPNSEIYEEATLFVDLAFAAEKTQKEVINMMKPLGLEAPRPWAHLRPSLAASMAVVQVEA